MYRSFFKILFVSLISASFLTLNLSGCTLKGSKSSSESEMDEELDDLSGSDSEVADSDDSDSDSEDDLSDVEDVASKTEEDITADASSDADSAPEEGDAEAGSKTAAASTGDEDDEFLAEDSPAPAADEAPDQALAEQDLEKELGPKTSTAAALEEEKNKIPLMKAEEPAPSEGMAAQAIPKEDTLDSIPVPQGTTDLASAGVITSKESTFGTSDSFENINPGPSLPKEDLGVSDPLVSEVDPPLPSVKAAKEVVPVSKISRDPFFRNERLMNAVFIARPGDDWGTISQKIYNEDRVANLLSDNPHLTRGIESGDKVYYNSPNRPDDKKIILTYFEDNKMAPAYYTTEEGDDIQKIGRRVLGYEDAWKEIWAVNEGLQTQALLPAGLKIRYWSGNEMKPNTMLAGVAGEPQPEVVGSSTTEAVEPPIDIPSPASTGSADMLSSQDPMSAPINSEPVPLLPDSSVSPAAGDMAIAKKDDSLGTMAAIALIGLGAVALVAMQIKNRKKSDSNLPPSLEFTKV